ncbi:MAG: internalization-related competence protein ComEC/Rec2, partial [Herminiimonas sp.]|nr:internalization-related competence protein ComEC/Rec2 [Herminiimonas sp.]
MRSVILGFVAGICWLQTRATLPELPIIGVLFIAGIVLGGVTRAFQGFMFRLPLLLTCGAVLGFSWAALFAQYYLAGELPLELEGQDITVIGTIDSLPSHSAAGTRFNFAVERTVQAGPAPVLPSRLALSWYAEPGAANLPIPAMVEPGERWQLTVRLRRPHGNANPYGFDYEAWLLEQNLRATGSVRRDETSVNKNRRLDRFAPSFSSVVERTRSWLRARILVALADKKYAAVMVALVVGDQRDISQPDWKVFNRTGIGHLISISGLHITMIAGLFASLVFALWRRSFFTGAQLPLLLPAQKAAALAGVAAALLYVLLAGFGVPAQRTLYMLAVVAAALWSGRITSISHVLCTAL